MLNPINLVTRYPIIGYLAIAVLVLIPKVGVLVDLQLRPWRPPFPTTPGYMIFSVVGIVSWMLSIRFHGHHRHTNIGWALMVGLCILCAGTPPYLGVGWMPPPPPYQLLPGTVLGMTITDVLICLALFGLFVLILGIAVAAANPNASSPQNPDPDGAGANMLVGFIVFFVCILLSGISAAFLAPFTLPNHWFAIWTHGAAILGTFLGIEVVDIFLFELSHRPRLNPEAGWGYLIILVSVPGGVLGYSDYFWAAALLGLFLWIDDLSPKMEKANA